MKLLYVITLAEHGGAQAHVRTLLACMREQAELALATSAEGWLTQQARALGVPVYLVPELVQPLSPGKDIRAVHALHQLLRQLKPDLVHLHSSKAGLLGRIAARLAGIPAVFTAHGWAFTEGASANRRRLAIWSERLAAPLATRIISVSGYDTELAGRCRVGHSGQVVTIHNGIPELAGGRTQPDSPSSCRVVMTARFAPPKDQAALIRAVAQVPEIRLTLIGEGELLPAAQALAAELGIQDRVTFLGARSDVPELLCQADVFALISNYEGFPISILEAMRAGLPVIASDVGGVREAVQPGVNGLLVPRADEAALVSALRTLATDEQRRRAMGAASRERFVEEFTDDAMSNAVWGVYLDALLRPPR
ncbi:glycosyl transferase, group 1 family [Deinococcus aerius]|uniref:Glycosyl transferase, group 1 family n=1 Tax=Deinococcus aerius TaxID=200253 RepID=A0A2I9CXA5_9DEIO|nr:glycosyltransferase family 4 protein [Deinococcus aerius]GBF06704.1 glycosyl transferase, group 1 family [Deinococcus aerius]